MKNAPSPLASLKSRPFVSSPLASGDFFASASPRNVERSPTDHSRPRSRFFRERNSHLQRYRDFQPDLSTNEKDKSPGFLALQTLSRIETSFIEIQRRQVFLFLFEQFFERKKRSFHLFQLPRDFAFICVERVIWFYVRESYNRIIMQINLIIFDRIPLSISISAEHFRFDSQRFFPIPVFLSAPRRDFTSRSLSVLARETARGTESLEWP